MRAYQLFFHDIMLIKKTIKTITWNYSAGFNSASSGIRAITGSSSYYLEQYEVKSARSRVHLGSLILIRGSRWFTIMNRFIFIGECLVIAKYPITWSVSCTSLQLSNFSLTPSGRSVAVNTAMNVLIYNVFIIWSREYGSIPTKKRSFPPVCLENKDARPYTDTGGMSLKVRVL